VHEACQPARESKLRDSKHLRERATAQELCLGKITARVRAAHPIRVLDDCGRKSRLGRSSEKALRLEDRISLRRTLGIAL